MQEFIASNSVEISSDEDAACKCCREKTQSWAAGRGEGGFEQGLSLLGVKAIGHGVVHDREDELYAAQLDAAAVVQDGCALPPSAWAPDQAGTAGLTVAPCSRGLWRK